MSKINTLLILCLLVLVYDLRSKRPVTKVTHMKTKIVDPQGRNGHEIYREFMAEAGRRVEIASRMK